MSEAGSDGGAFPFDAVVGQDDAKLALRLAARDPLIGGVLLRGQKGSGKTTLARGLAALLGDAPFVDLPIGATEDRVVGTLDTRAALTGGEFRFDPGLLAAADGGVLYVDEINLLPDHLVDVLLDVAVSGENVVERDGVSYRHPARFVLVGSMNPEEGELRPQLLDRFGLCVDVTASVEIADRVEAIRRRLAFDAGGDAGQGRFWTPGSVPNDRSEGPEPVPETLWAPDPVPGDRSEGPERVVGGVSDEVLEAASRLAVEVGAEGLRADLTLCRAAAALAALEHRDAATTEDLRRVAALVLAHRSRRGPFDPPVVPPEHLEQAIEEVLAPPDDAGGDDDLEPPEDTGESDQPGSDQPGDADGPEGGSEEGGPAPERPMVVGSMRRAPTPPPSSKTSSRGRVVRDDAAGPTSKVAVVPSLRAAAAKRRSDPGAELDEGDLRTAVRETERSRVTVLCVDLSGSMGAPERAAAASGTVLGLLADAYERRHKVGLVTFRGPGAQTVLRPTTSIEVARNRLDALSTGGETPLAEGLAEALRIAEQSIDDTTEGLVAVLTDGRATGSPDALDRAVEVAGRIARSEVEVLVLDCETGTTRLGLAARLAEAMGARLLPVSDLTPEHVTHTVRAAIGA